MGPAFKRRVRGIENGAYFLPLPTIIKMKQSSL